MMDFGPICSLCTRDWDERLGYCEYCESTNDEDTVAGKKKTKKKNLKVVTSLLPRRTDTPVYEQLTVDFGFAPDQSSDWHHMPGGTGLLEDNFS